MNMYWGNAEEKPRYQIRMDSKIIKPGDGDIVVTDVQPFMRVWDFTPEPHEFLQSLELWVLGGEILPLLIFPFTLTGDGMYIRREPDPPTMFNYDNPEDGYQT